MRSSAYTHARMERQTDKPTDRDTHSHTKHTHQPIYIFKVWHTLASSLLGHKNVASQAPSLPSVAPAASLPLQRASCLLSSTHPPHTRQNAQAAGTSTCDQTAEMAKKPSSTAPTATARNSALGGLRPAPRKLRIGRHAQPSTLSAPAARAPTTNHGILPPQLTATLLPPWRTFPLCASSEMTLFGPWKAHSKNP